MLEGFAKSVNAASSLISELITIKPACFLVKSLDLKGVEDLKLNLME